MIAPSLTPTRLVEPGARPPVPISEPIRPARGQGLKVCRVLLLLGLWLIGRTLTRRLDPRTLGIRLRTMFEELGGLWLHAGHLLSLRIDIFSREVCEELALLHGKRSGFPAAEARRVLEEDLGAPIAQYFDEFSDEPFAVAPIAQVHRARLRMEQRYVAVKIQQPYIDEVFARDLKHISRLVRLIIWLRIRPHLLWEFALDELREQTAQLVNLHYEASAIRRMRKRLRGQRVKVPELFPRYCGRRVLVTEFIHAALMADVLGLMQTDPARLDLWLTENNIEPRRVARRLIFSTLRQILEHNLYHGDPSPGHLVLLRDSTVALIEFTSATFSELEYLAKFRLFLKALATRDYAKAADMSFMLCASLPNIDTEEVKAELVRALRAWATRTLVKELPYREKSLDNAFIEVLRVLVRYRCTMAWGWLRIRRAIMTLDLSLEHLHRDVNYTRLLQHYFDEAEARAIDKLTPPVVARRAIGSYLTALDIQDRVNEYTMFQGALVRRHAQVFQASTNKAAAVFAAILAEIALLLGVVVAGAIVVFLVQQYPERTAGWLGPQLTALVNRVPILDPAIWIVIAIVLGYSVWSLFWLRRRLQEKDVRPHERVATV